MANALLDFVMSLVRDPEAAARYAADPAQSIADAHLTGVTSADVSNLIPMVSDSLSMSNPGESGSGTNDHGNVWTSGAATAAFDAFSEHVSVQDPGVNERHGLPTHVIEDPPTGGVGEAAGSWTDPNPVAAQLHDPSATITAPDEVSDLPVHESGFGMDDPGGWDHPLPDSQTVENEHHGFDHFG
jgi:hypothetical protein